ncbi:MAG: C cytochrome precursor [Pedosphaera sp.]|nr:C cytochrome precursor [Pedosphaera sp.]
MALEPVIVALVLAAGFFAGWQFRRQWRFWPAVALASAWLGILGWSYQRHLQQSENSRDRLAAMTPVRRQSGGYVGSSACQTCHPQEHSSWHRSYHRTMTQLASPAATPASFDNVTLQQNGRTYELRRRGHEFFVEIDDPEGARAIAVGRVNKIPRIERRITLVTGSHNLQAFWFDAGRGNRQQNLPFTWLLDEKRWVPRNDVFLLPPDFRELNQTWNENCLRCHVTAGIPDRDGRSGHRSQVAELGIACESCHGPGGPHVDANRNLLTRYAKHATKAADPTILNPARMNHRDSAATCGACHAVSWIPDMAAWAKTGFTHRPGQDLEADRRVIQYPEAKNDPRLPEEMRQTADALVGTFWRDGMIRVSGREYNGLLKSACFQKGTLSCLSCHSMHDSAPDDQLAVNRHGNAACTECHREYIEPARLVAHTHHTSISEGSQCYNCHMPHTTFGLMKAIRSHQISNPSVAETLEVNRPNACNLCHLDQTLEWTRRNMESWHARSRPSRELTVDEKTVPAWVLWVLTGDASVRGLAAWHASWPPAVSTSSNNWQAPIVASLLNDPYSVVRHIAGRSLRQLPEFADFAYDYLGDPAGRAEAVSKVRARWVQTQGVKPIRISEEIFARLSATRDNSPVELVE